MVSGEQSSMVSRSTKGRHATIASGRKVGRAGVLLAVALVMVLSATGALPAGAAGPDFEHVHALMFDAGARALWLGAHTGVYRSEDGGRTWMKVAVPSTHHGPDVMTIAAHPSDAAVLYVGTHDEGVLKTVDAGQTWTAVNTGLRGVDVHGLAVDPSTPDKLHALVRDTGAGVYRSTDGGREWIRVDDGPAGETKVLVSVNLPTGMGGIFLYAGTAEGLQRSADCF